MCALSVCDVNFISLAVPHHLQGVIGFTACEFYDWWTYLPRFCIEKIHLTGSLLKKRPGSKDVCPVLSISLM